MQGLELMVFAHALRAPGISINASAITPNASLLRFPNHLIYSDFKPVPSYGVFDIVANNGYGKTQIRSHQL